MSEMRGEEYQGKNPNGDRRQGRSKGGNQNGSSKSRGRSWSEFCRTHAKARLQPSCKQQKQTKSRSKSQPRIENPNERYGDITDFSWA